MAGSSLSSPERLGRYRRGHRAEWIAAVYFVMRGHRILARRLKTVSGEIDLITLKTGRVAFVEVKRRNTRAECEAAITPKLRNRVHRAANLWLAKNPQYQQHDLGFDIVFVMPRRWPVHLKNAL